MTAPNESLIQQPELTFFAREICNRLKALTTAESPYVWLFGAILVTAELTRELQHSPELVEEFIRACRAQQQGLH
jgi:hypothetical protein